MAFLQSRRVALEGRGERDLLLLKGFDERALLLLEGGGVRVRLSLHPGRRGVRDLLPRADLRLYRGVGAEYAELSCGYAAGG